MFRAEFTNIRPTYIYKRCSSIPSWNRESNQLKFNPVKIISLCLPRYGRQINRLGIRPLDTFRCLVPSSLRGNYCSANSAGPLARVPRFVKELQKWDQGGCCKILQAGISNAIWSVTNIMGNEFEWADYLEGWNKYVTNTVTRCFPSKSRYPRVTLNLDGPDLAELWLQVWELHSINGSAPRGAAPAWLAWGGTLGK